VQAVLEQVVGRRLRFAVRSLVSRVVVDTAALLRDADAGAVR
jgi:hypothetical protein